MGRSIQRENVLLGYSPQRSLENPSSSSPKSLSRNSDIDFNDVFGGPPRRFSIQETHLSFNGEMDSERASSCRRWSGLSEKPVFGEENGNRRRYQGDDFFDDIYGGEETCNSPRRTDRDAFGSSPGGSLVLSPGSPLPPKAEHFDTSLPAQFSLPAKLTKAMDYPVFASGNCSPSKYKDRIANGAGHLSSQSASLSRFSSQVIPGQIELKNDDRPYYYQSPLSPELFPCSEDTSNRTQSDLSEKGCNLKKDSTGTNALNNSSQFHFSIYKWAGQGVPLLMPFRGGNITKSKETGKTDRSSSSNGRIEGDIKNGNLRAIESLVLNHSIASDTKPSKIEEENQCKESNQNRVEPCRLVEETILDMPELKPHNSDETVENVPDGTIFRGKKEEKKPHSLPDIGLPGKTEKGAFMVTKEACKAELKTPSSLLNCDIEEQGDKEITPNSDGKEKGEKMTKVSLSNVDASRLVKKNDGKRINSNRAGVEKANLQGSPITLGDKLGRTEGKGKVKEFVKIFNQEASPKPKLNVTRTQKARQKGTSIHGADNGANVGTTKMDTKSQLPNGNNIPDASSSVDETAEHSEKESAQIKTTATSDYSFSQKVASSFPAALPDDSNVTDGIIDVLFHENFMIKELPHDQDKLSQTGEDYEDVQMLKFGNGQMGRKEIFAQCCLLCNMFFGLGVVGSLFRLLI
ncbi:unnamed protein product [Ilex paraguariensis]|uniref:Uncharacterized protein n=1 Tax=Ilex paraguariensis TaxID=185542 RepID=A0ABC8UDI5_9AQUA